MTTTINYNVRVNGVLTDATSVVFADSPAPTYGVRISPGGAVVVAAGTALTHVGTGQYQYSFSDPSPGLTYEYVVKPTIGGASYYDRQTIASGDTPTTVPTSAYTSLTEIQRLVSDAGVAMRLDDLTDTSSELSELINDATDTINQYTWLLYQTSDLVTSNWVRRRATYIAAWLLSQRRGNPEQFVTRYNIILEELQSVYQRQLYIPNLPINDIPTPALSNYIMDNRGMGPVARILPQDSIGTYPGQKTINDIPTTT